MLADPVLGAHLRAHGVFDLSGVAPASIKDQMVRSRYLAARLLSSGLLGTSSRLLVVGGGIAGANLAIIAARSGVDVTLLDSEPTLFTAQANCRTRWLDPVQYDWPLLHADQGLKLHASAVRSDPLAFAAGRAAAIAVYWIGRFNKERKATGRKLKVEVNVKDFDFQPTQAGARVEVSYQPAPPRKPVKDSFDIVVLCKGVLKEKTEMPPVELGGVYSQFTGVRFWSSDTLEQQGFGLPAKSTGQVLVSGAGDGGLQDYIRLTTGQASALALLHEMVPLTPDGNALRQELHRGIHEIEHPAQRALFWNKSGVQDHGVLAAVHTSYVDLLGRWRERRPRQWVGAMSTLERLTASRAPQRVQLLHGCTHFGNCYPLNRIVTLLMAAHVADKYGIDPIIGRSRLESVSPPVESQRYAHFCKEAECWGKPHQVRLSSGITCHATGGLKLQPRAVDGLVVRHGVAQHQGAALRRQVLPHRMY